MGDFIVTGPFRKHYWEGGFEGSTQILPFIEGGCSDFANLPGGVPKCLAIINYQQNQNSSNKGMEHIEG